MLSRTNNKDNISFDAAFALKCNRRQGKTFTSFVQNQMIKNAEKPQVASCRFNHSTIVFTDFDSFDFRYNKNRRELLEHKSYIDAQAFYNPYTENLKDGVIDFNPSSGIYSILHSVKKRGLTFFFKKDIAPDNSAKINAIPKLKFPSRKNLGEAIEILCKLDYSHLHSPELKKQFSNFLLYKEAIKRIPGLKNLHVSNIDGAGLYSLFFKLDNKLSLKLSTEPMYPIKFETFDYPTNETGYIKINSDTVYYAISPKGENSNEIFIPASKTKDVINKIEQSGYEITDMNELETRQIAIYKGKPYLCDYQCAVNKDGEDRLFIAP